MSCAWIVRQPSTDFFCFDSGCIHFSFALAGIFFFCGSDHLLKYKMGWGRATVEESFYMCIRIDSISIVAGLRSSYTFIVTCCDKYSYDENWWSWREFICLLYCLSWNPIYISFQLYFPPSLYIILFDWFIVFNSTRYNCYVALIFPNWWVCL